LDPEGKGEENGKEVALPSLLSDSGVWESVVELS